MAHETSCAVLMCGIDVMPISLYGGHQHLWVTVFPDTAAIVRTDRGRCCSSSERGSSMVTVERSDITEPAETGLLKRRRNRWHHLAAAALWMRMLVGVVSVAVETR